MYLEAQRQKTEYEYTKNTKRSNGVTYNSKLSNNMYNDVRIQYKKPKDSAPGMQPVQKEDGIEKGIMVYVLSERKAGRIQEEKERTYMIDFGIQGVLEVSKYNVAPMYSNTGSSNANFDSVMANGVLSPKDRAERGIVPSVTTDDKRASNYHEKDQICVNVFSTASDDRKKMKNQKKSTFYNESCGAYLVALENDDAPKLPLPPVEKCEEYLKANGKNQEVEIRRQELLKAGMPEECIPNFIKMDIFSRYIEENDEIANVLRTIFEERLKRTMLIISPAPDSENEYGESNTGSIYPANFTWVLLPEEGYVTPERRENEKVIIVSSTAEKLIVPANRYFTDAQNHKLDVKVLFEIVLDVPDYKGAYEELLGTLPKGKYYSHIVRL